MSRNLTIKDVARLSGFSIRTVSRVINDEGYVKEETRSIIKKIINETGYETNIFAKNLRKKSVRNIILLIEREKEPHPGQYYSNMFQCAINEARKYGFNAFMLQFDTQNAKENEKNIQILKSGFVDGAIVFSVKKSLEKIKLLKKLNIPFVSMAKNNEEGCSYVDVDHFKSAYIATEHLIKKGCESLGLMIGDPELIAFDDRKQGFLKAVKDYNISQDNIKVYENVEAFKHSYKICFEMGKEKMPDGLFVASDEMAFGVLKAMSDLKISVPDEVMVVGFDNLPLSEYSVPALTTMRQNATEMSEEAVSILMKLIEKSEEDFQKQVLYDPELIIRDTTK